MIDPNTPFGTDPENTTPNPSVTKWASLADVPFADETKYAPAQRTSPAYSYGTLIRGGNENIIGKVVSAPFENEQDAKQALAADSEKINGYSANHRAAMLSDGYYYIIEPN